MLSDRPNILLITSDQHHWMSIGVQDPQVQTPNLDRLAKAGMLFNRAYCPNPTCTPTRASIITGKYPSQHGAYSLGTKLLESEHTVGEDFRNAGYGTALIGKAHFQPLRSRGAYFSLEAYPVLQDLDYWRSFNGPFYGFDHVELARNHVDEAHVGQHYAIWMEEKGLSNWRDYFRQPTGKIDRQEHTWELPEEYHYNVWIAERSIAAIDRYLAQGRPFFLWSSFFDPHPGYLVPRPWDRMYDPARIDVPQVTEGEHQANPPHHQETQKSPTDADFKPWCSTGMGNHGMGSHRHDRDQLAKDIAIYYGMISCMDKYIGKILDHLDDTGLTGKTLVVFSTDHGHFFGQHGLIAKGPFHYEDMVRVPMIVRQPGVVPAGVRSDALQSLVDLPQTFLSHCRIKEPWGMTGVNQMPAWSDPSVSVRDHVIVENRHEPDTIHLKTYITDRYKLTVYYHQSYGELFDLQTDPGEVNNLWDSPEHAALKNELMVQFLHAEMGKEPLPMPRIAGA